jgi:hypothetical protein
MKIVSKFITCYEEILGILWWHRHYAKDKYSE